MQRKLGFVVVVLTFCGCAVAQKGTHTVGIMALDLQAAAKVAVAVLDRREDVMNGERQPSWIGLQRSLYGIPYGVATASGRPFSEELSVYLVRSLQQAGIDAESVSIAAGSDRSEAVDLLRATNRPRLLLVQLDEWFADTYNQTTLHYDVTLDVLDARGTTVANSSLAGEDDLGRNMRVGRRYTTEATADIMRSLLSAKDVATAIASTEEALAASKKRCTVQQILQMRESGLNEEQIHAACGE